MHVLATAITGAVQGAALPLLSDDQPAAPKTLTIGHERVFEERS